MSVPEPPPTVPSGAIWDARRREWLAGHKDLSGRWHGLVTGYDEAGLLRSRQHFDAGVADGLYVRLHPSGAEAYRATFVAGKLHGDARAISSREPGAVPLRSCCVPRGAWALVTRYDHGNTLDEWFENESGCPLLTDGSPRPPRPATVPEAAGFDEHNPGWVLGQSHDTLRQGCWKRWSIGGELVEVTHLQQGKLHGSATTYQAGRVVRQREYVNGVLQGPAAERAVSPGTFEDARIRGWLGAFSGGNLAGRWTYRDEGDNLLLERDYGAPCRRVELTHPVFAATPPETGWAGLAQALSRAGNHGLALCASIRAAIASRDAPGLRAALHAMTVPLGSAESARRLVELRKPRERTQGGAPVQQEAELGAWIQGLLEGASPALVLAQLGVLLLGAPRAGLDFIDAAMTLDPALPTLLKVRARLWFELGQPAKASEEAAELRLAHPQQVGWVDQISRLLFPRFEFWPAQATFDLEPNPELPAVVSQPLARVRSAVAKSALRFGHVRQALIRALTEHGRSVNGGSDVPSEPCWLPPELSALLAEPAPSLERYEFTDTSGADDPNGEGGNPDTVKVDETAQTAGLGIVALMGMARVEWTCLCWLCWGAGLERVGLPDQLRPPAEFARALSAAFFQVFRVLDSRQTRGLRSKSRGLPGARWEGLNVDALDPQLLEMAFREAREVRAVLFWLGDADCRSLWQDDLRDV